MIPAIKYQPAFADQSWKKLTKKSIDYHAFWDQEIDRCVNGYKPSGGVWIPGNYYFYINYCTIERYIEESNRKLDEIPAYRDQDHEYFQEFHDAEKNGHGLVIGKARRKGFSFNNMGIGLGEFCFNPGSQIGVGSEVEKYVNDFRERTLKSFFALPKELRPRLLHKNKLLLMSGYREKDKTTGEFLEKGMKSMIHFRVMDPTGKNSAFRGLSLKIVFFEELGEWRSAKKHLASTEECYREGASQFGVPVLGGTSQQITNESKDYFELYHNGSKYNLKKIFIPATKVYAGKEAEGESFFDYKTGISDVVGAEAHIEARAQALLNSGDMLAYYAFRQEMPIKEEHMFMHSSNTPFNLDKINKQIARVINLPKMRIAQPATLEWPKGKDGKQIKFAKPEMKYDPMGKFMIAEIPLPNHRNGHVAAVDPYFIDDKFEEKKRTKTRKVGQSSDRSDGCMNVYRRFINVDIPGELPVAEYCDRPATKDEFYENCAKLCLFYDVQMLGEYNDAGLFDYFVKNGLHRFLKERPRSADAPYSEATNKYGIHMKDFQKKLLTDLVADYIENHIEDIYFLELLHELGEFGPGKNTDRVMAFGMSLIHNMDNMKRVISLEEEKKEDLDFMPYYRKDKDGNIEYVSSNLKLDSF